MKRRFLTIALVFIIAFSITTSALAQSYSFRLDKEVVNVYLNSDGSMSLDYVFTFTNQPGAHAIDFVMWACQTTIMSIARSQRM